MAEISYRRAVGRSFGAGGLQDAHGVSIKLFEQRNEVVLEGQIVLGNETYKNGSMIGIPANPVILDEVIKTLKQISESRKTKHRDAY